MAKKRIYDYVFRPGISATDNIYPNAYYLLTQNKSFLQKELREWLSDQVAHAGTTFTPTAINYSPATGVMVITIGAHSLTNNDVIRFKANSLVFTCELDDNETEHTYPRGSGVPNLEGYDPTYDEAVAITEVDATTITVNVGISSDTSAHTFVRAKSDCILVPYTPTDADYNPTTGSVELTIGSHDYQVGDLIRLEADCITLNNGSDVTVPTNANSPFEITARTATTITITVDTNSAGDYTFVSAQDGCIFSQFFGYTYDADKCERDAGYVLDSYAYDLRYGGNQHTVKTAKLYWDGDVSQVDENQLAEVDAHTFLRNLINRNILTNTPFADKRQTLVSQVIDATKPAEDGTTTRITTLSDIIITVIPGGLDTVPTLVPAGVGILKVKTRVTPADMLITTNADKNEIIYAFNDPDKGGTLTYETEEDEDFPKFLQVTDAITTIELNYDTSTHDASDDIQIFVDSRDLIVRPYEFGTDAIERMRIAPPLSMLDADFEYGLQPTKWSAIGTLRGYPSAYEVPGTDTSIATVVTDASAGTDGVGASLITVTTAGAHGFIEGNPITIKALDAGVDGAQRAEGTFIIVSVPEINEFTYYAKAKVGDTEGERLETTYSQLREAKFYTGATIGTPSFSVASQGSSGTLTTSLIVSQDDDFIAWEGDAPEIGSPLVDDGLELGTQVTAVIGTGGVAATPTTTADQPIGATSIEVDTVEDVTVGTAIDRGDGRAVTVITTVGNNINLSGPLTDSLVGNNVTYSNVEGVVQVSSGSGAQFDISRAGGVYTVDNLDEGGSGYFEGDILIVTGAELGGTTPENDAQILVDTVDTSGTILTYTISGSAFDGTASYTALPGQYTYGEGTGALFDITYNNNVYAANLRNRVFESVSGVNQGGAGTGAEFNVTSAENSYSVVIQFEGDGYTVDDVILIQGDSLGGSTPENDLYIKIDTVDSVGGITAVTLSGTGADANEVFTSPNFTTSGSGIGASFNVTMQGSSYDVIFSLTGTGFAPSDTLTIVGSELGGVDSVNDCTITVDTVDTGGEILTFSVAGTATNTHIYENTVGSNVIGSSATFDVELDDGSYVVTINTGGVDYATGQDIVIAGTDLGGSTPENDLTLNITGIQTDSTVLIDEITSVSASGTAVYSTQDYKVNDKLRVVGSALGGVDDTNDLDIVISSVGDSGNITGFNISGTAPNADFEYIDPDTTTSGSGTNATFNVRRQGLVYSAQLINAGSGYLPNDTITVLGSDLGGADSTNDCTITVSTVDAGGEILTFNVVGTAKNEDLETGLNTSPTTVVGFGASFDVDQSAGAYVVSINQAGEGYTANQEIIIEGTTLNGVTPDNDLTITITTVDGSGAITAVSSSGTASTDVASFTDVVPQLKIPSGTGASFNVVRNSGAYETITVSNGGTSFDVGNRLVISGDDLGGSLNLNDLTLTITEIDSDGSVVNFTSEGLAATGTTLNLYSTVTISEPAEADITVGTEIDFEALATIEVSFQYEHGLVPGNSFLVSITTDNGSNNHTLAGGSYLATAVPSTTSLRYQARAAGTIDVDDAALNGDVYPRPDSFFIHRPFDGGVQLGTGGPQHGGQAIRQSKKYIRYQSGKGIMYTTGALFAPSYDLRSANASGLEVGSEITFVTDDNDHGLQVGAVVKVINIETAGYNSTYTVTDIVDERTFKVLANKRLGDYEATLGFDCQMSTVNWNGATVRSGIFDDQNGIFWEYDGTNLSVVQRTSTKQIAGTALCTPDSNRIIGTNTRFRDQLKAGDRIVVRGMTHVVAHVNAQTEITVTPDYRGVNTADGVKIMLITDKKVKQEDFNLDKMDGTGPSRYNVLPEKMQMIGIQYSWYGAGFIDFMMRGADGNFVFAHRMRNSNVNTEAYMRSGNLPVRYEVTNEGAVDRLKTDITGDQTTIPLFDASFFPPGGGTVYIDNELISFSGVNYTTNELTGCGRGATLTNFNSGAQRSYSAGDAASHTARTGVILVSNTTTPLISHWGSSFITDGNFDEDRGYIFSYAEKAIDITTTRQTAFLMRLAPSVSNAIVGDLGDRELLNRAQLLLQGIEVTSDPLTGGDTGAVVIEGILNPQNYPLNPNNITWTALSGLAQGGQPSFAQVASGASVTWSTGQTTTNSTATVQANLTAVLNAGQNNSGTNQNFIWISANDYRDTFGTSSTAPVLGRGITGSNLPAGTIITDGYISPNAGSNYGYFRINNRTTSSVTRNTANQYTVTFNASTSNTNVANFNAASFVSSGAGAGTIVTETGGSVTFPGNSYVVDVKLESWAGTDYYQVTFNNVFSGTLTQGSGTVQFEFSQPPYAQPGETVFSFISAPGERSSLSLETMKEMTNTTLGGRGTFPNGPDVLAINVYKTDGSDITGSVILRWGEAQA